MKKPLLFKPILVQRVWGGTRLLSKASSKVGLPIGESWEISDIPDYSSVIVNGDFAGKNLHDIFLAKRDYLLGDARSQVDSERFPLLLKLLDSSDDLSLQVHPDDDVARSHHGAIAKGKHEAWFIINAMPEAEFYYGLTSSFTKCTFQEVLLSGNLDMVFNAIPVSSGDYIDVPPGTIHGIGKGVLLAEIQDASDITYRLFDWNRLPARKLHIEEALDSINFIQNDLKSFNSSDALAGSNDYTLIENGKFTVTKVDFSQNEQVRRKTFDQSFHIILSLSQMVEVEADGASVSLKMLDTCLIPAAANQYSLFSPLSKGCVLVFATA